MFGRRKELPLWSRLKGWLWPAMGWRRHGVYLLKRLMRLQGTPHNIAAGFACGAALSFTPFVGFHIVLAILLAYLIRGHFLAAIVGTAVGNPWTFPFIWLATYKVGQVMLGAGDAAPWPAVVMFRHVVTDFGNLIWPILTGQMPLMTFKQLMTDLRALVWPMTVGCVPLGLAAGFLTYFPLVRMIGAWQSAKLRRRERQAKQRARDLATDARATGPGGYVG